MLTPVPVRNVSGRAVLGAAFSITGTSGTYQEVNGGGAGDFAITLPEPGTYLVGFVAKAVLTGATGACFMVAKLYNQTAGADVTESETILQYNVENAVRQDNPATLIMPLTVTVATELRMHARRNGTTWTLTNIGAGTDGQTSLFYVRLF